MRYSKDHKEQSRQRIIEVAAQQFGERGIDGVGLASIMTGAGLTNGAFFNHFSSKEELATEALDHAMARASVYLEDRTDGYTGIEKFIRSYLSVRHRDNAGLGCPVATLAADVARHSTEVRGAFTGGIESFIGVLMRAWPALPRRAARGRALALYGMMAGCLQMARATDDEKLSAETLSGGIKAALSLLEN